MSICCSPKDKNASHWSLLPVCRSMPCLPPEYCPKVSQKLGSGHCSSCSPSIHRNHGYTGDCFLEKYLSLMKILRLCIVIIPPLKLTLSSGMDVADDYVERDSRGVTSSLPMFEHGLIGYSIMMKPRTGRTCGWVERDAPKLGNPILNLHLLGGSYPLSLVTGGIIING